MKILRDTSKDQFLNEVNHRVIPHITHGDSDIEAKARIAIMLTMKDSEGVPKERKIHTPLVPIRLRSGADRNSFFQGVQDQWVGVYNKYTKHAVGDPGTEAWLRDFMNPIKHK